MEEIKTDAINDVKTPCCSKTNQTKEKTGNCCGKTTKTDNSKPCC